MLNRVICKLDEIHLVVVDIRRAQTVNHRQEINMANASKAVVDQIKDQVDKVAGEYRSTIATLEQKITDGTISVEDLQPLKDAVQGLDDIVPDPEAPAEPEAPVEPAE